MTGATATHLEPVDRDRLLRGAKAIADHLNALQPKGRHYRPITDKAISALAASGESPVRKVSGIGIAVGAHAIERYFGLRERVEHAGGDVAINLNRDRDYLSLVGGDQ